jgi:hypothetical protein
MTGSLYAPAGLCTSYSDMATQQSPSGAHPTAVGMFSHPLGGPDTRHVLPASEVVAIS